MPVGSWLGPFHAEPSADAASQMVLSVDDWKTTVRALAYCTDTNAGEMLLSMIRPSNCNGHFVATLPPRHMISVQDFFDKKKMFRKWLQ